MLFFSTFGNLCLKNCYLFVREKKNVSWKFSHKDELMISILHLFTYVVKENFIELKKREEIK